MAPRETSLPVLTSRNIRKGASPQSRDILISRTAADPDNPTKWRVLRTHLEFLYSLWGGSLEDRLKDQGPDGMTVAARLIRIAEDQSRNTKKPEPLSEGQGSLSIEFLNRFKGEILSEFKRAHADLLKELQNVPATSVPPMDKPLWSREELAAFLKVKPSTVSKQVVAERKRNRGKDPLWVYRLPGRQRGFKVRWNVYQRLMESARVPYGARRAKSKTL